MSGFRYGTSALLGALIAFALAIAWPAPMRAAEGDLKLVRATLSRSLSAPFIWGLNPIGEKYGLRTQVLDAMTNADQQRNIQTGAVEIGSVGYQSAAVMAEQNVGNVKIIAGMYVAGQNLIMRKGVELKSWKDIEGKKIGRPPGSYAAILFTLAAEINEVDLSKVNLVNITPAGAPELAALKNGDLDGFVMWSPVIDRAVIEGYGYYPECCDIGGTKEFGAGNQLLAANAEFLKDRKSAVTFLKAYVEAMDYYRQESGQDPCVGRAIYWRLTSRPERVHAAFGLDVSRGHRECGQCRQAGPKIRVHQSLTSVARCPVIST